MKPLIIFDVDGTLLDAVTADATCFDSAFREITGVALTQDLWSTFDEVTAPSIVRQALGSEWPELKDVEERILDAFLARLQDGHRLDPTFVRPFAGALELVLTLKQSADFQVAIATGCWRETAHFKLTAAGFDWIDLPFACASDRHRRAEIIRLAAERAGAPVEQAIYIGDGVWDLKATRDLGIPFIGVGRKRAELRRAGARHTLDELSLKNLLETVDQITRSGHVPA